MMLTRMKEQLSPPELGIPGPIQAVKYKKSTFQNPNTIALLLADYFKFDYKF